MSSKIEKVLAEFKTGKMLIVVDDEERENEGDLIMPAEKVTPEDVNFMITHGRGLVCLALPKRRLVELKLPLMVESNTAYLHTAFTVSVDLHREGFTGISAQDRAETIAKLIDPNTRPDDLARPGHIFPLEAKEGGVLTRPGHTEAGYDLARLSGLFPGAVMCEILDEDGSTARRGALKKFAEKHNLSIISVKELIDYRRLNDPILSQETEIELPTEYGTFRVIVYQNIINKDRHLVFVHGKPTSGPALVRIHSECLTGDTFGSLKCDCGRQLDVAMRAISQSEYGILIYTSQEGRGIGLINKLKAYALQQQGFDTLEANHHLGFGGDLRDYSLCAHMLADQKISQVQLMTNNPDKVRGLETYGITVIERVPLEFDANEHNGKYLETKQAKMGHLLNKIEKL